jgi:hypothetical protein
MSFDGEEIFHKPSRAEIGTEAGRSWHNNSRRIDMYVGLFFDIHEQRMHAVLEIDSSFRADKHSSRLLEPDGQA